MPSNVVTVFIIDWLEWGLGYFFINFRAWDLDLFVRSPAFKWSKNPTITITSPSGPSGCMLAPIHTDCYNIACDYTHCCCGAKTFPPLEWSPCPGVSEYILCVEDVDATALETLGLYYAIPGNVTRICSRDLVDMRGMKLGKNLDHTVYLPPRATLGHGLQRVVFQLIALREPLGELCPLPTKETLIEEIEGKVLGWGVWIGIHERKKKGFGAWKIDWGLVRSLRDAIDDDPWNALD